MELLPSRWRGWKEQAYTFCFRDQYGATLFVGSLVVFMLLGRVGVFLNDSYVMVNALSAVADGKLYPTEPVVGNLRAPGAIEVDGKLYGENYGMVFFALPIFWFIKLFDAIFSIRAVLVIVWSAFFIYISHHIGILLDHERRGLITGTFVGLFVLVANAAYWKPFYQVTSAEIALQLSTIIWASLTVLLVYRLIASLRTVKVGAIAAATTMLATPVIYWSSISKRHSMTAAFALLTVYFFYRSRSAPESENKFGERHFRAATYACVGLYAWTNSPEAFALFVAVLIVDLPTATHNDIKSATFIITFFIISLIPFFITNSIITGSPVKPLVMANTATTDPVQVAGGEASSPTQPQGSSGPQPKGNSGVSHGSQSPIFVLVDGIVTPVLSTLSPIFTALSTITDRYVESIYLVVNYGERVSKVLIRSGDRTSFVKGNSLYDGPGMNLSVLESAPIIGGLVLGLLVPIRDAFFDKSRLRERGKSIVKLIKNQVSPVDLLVLLISLNFILIYLPDLPINHSYTVRYLHPIYPLAVYGVFRISIINKAIVRHTKTLLLTYETLVLLGLPTAYSILYVYSPATGDVYQSYAVVGLATMVFMILMGIYIMFIESKSYFFAVTIGCAIGVASVFYVLNATILVHYGISLFPFLEEVLAQLRWLILQGL